MNWLIIVSNITLGLIAALLCVLSWSTIKKIKHLNVGKSFWVPVFTSSLLFAVCSIITIFNDIFFSSTIAVEIEQVAQLIAFCFLSIGIYSYSKMIRKNLPAKYIVPDTNSTQNDEIDAYIASTRSVSRQTTTSSNLEPETATKCNHQLGYLSTFPDNSSLPDECLSCNKVMECKHS
jgi:hypothetical protein